MEWLILVLIVALEVLDVGLSILVRWKAVVTVPKPAIGRHLQASFQKLKVWVFLFGDDFVNSVVEDIPHSQAVL